MTLVEKQKVIFTHYGLDNQMDKMKEECAELYIAIHNYQQMGTNFKNIIEEMADVKNVLEQLVIVFKRDITIEQHVKCDRQIERIKNESRQFDSIRNVSRETIEEEKK